MMWDFPFPFPLKLNSSTKKKNMTEKYKRVVVDMDFLSFECVNKKLFDYLKT